MMIFFKTTKTARPCGTQQHIYVPRDCYNKKIVGVIIEDEDQ